ncbi:MAG: hypothetical protein HUU16_08970 [Candidatus Omnitrophica bacterium]|nr:Alternative cytochrome c oxidase subunit 2 [bacterium]NUN96292.1 hypothetical protein [Candidatus Omnitrophota bacterium]
MRELLGLPILASEQGARIDLTLALIHALMAALFLGWAAFYLYCLYRYRRSRNPIPNTMGARSHLSTYAEFAVAAVMATILIGFSIPIWSQRVEDFPDEKDATVVHVIAKQFAWICHYAGPDGQFGARDPSLIDAANTIGLDRGGAGKDDVVIEQLHLPVGKPAILKLTSMDVIHCLYLPEMRVKQDVIPGSEIPIWFTPALTTEEFRARKQAEGLSEGTDPAMVNFQIACAQLCGVAHYSMVRTLVVHTPEGYEDWMRKEQEFLAAEAAAGEYEFEEETP